MKRSYISVLLVSAMVCSLMACGKNDGGESSSSVVSEMPVSSFDVVTDEADSESSEAKDLRLRATSYYIDSDVLDFETGSLVINGYGEILRNGDYNSPRVFPVYNDQSGEVRYYTETYDTYEKLGDFDYKDTPHSRLYALDGTLLIDWKDVVYRSAFGDWVISSDNKLGEILGADQSTNTLVNVKDGRTVEKVIYIQELNDDKIMLMDSYDHCFAVMDNDGNMDTGELFDLVSSGSMGHVNDYIYMLQYNDDIAHYTFLDPELKKTCEFTFPDYGYSINDRLVGPYVGFTEFSDNENKTTIYDLRGDGQGEPKSCFSAFDVPYYDGELVIAAQDGSGCYTLSTVSGEELFPAAGYIYPDFGAENGEYNALFESAACFYAVEGNQISQIDRTGTVLNSFAAPFDSISDFMLHKTAISYGDPYGSPDGTEKCGLLSKELTELVPAGICNWFSEEYDHATGDVIFRGYRGVDNGSRSLQNMYARDGKVIAADLSSIGQLKEGKIAIVKGMNYGLMDLEGNWLVRNTLTNLAPVESAHSVKLEVEGFDGEHLPRLDGSLANEPLLVRMMSDLTGADAETAETYLAGSFINGGTSTCWNRLYDEQTDLIISYEPPQEVKENLEEVMKTFEIDPLGRDGLVFIVNKDNPVESLTVDQVRDIYTGRITDWSEVGGTPGKIKAFQRNETSGSQTLLKKLVLKDEPAMTPDTEMLIGSMAQLIESVAEFDGSDAAIGFSVYYYADRMKSNPNLKMLKINDVTPGNASIGDSSYPLVNDFYMAIRKSEKKDSPIRRLRDVMLSETGRTILEDEGYVAAK